MYSLHNQVLSQDLIEQTLAHVNAKPMIQGKVGSRVAPEKKIRFDQPVNDPGILKHIDHHVLCGVCDEYKYREQWKVGIYIGDSGGFYTPHRDDWVDKGYRKQSIIISLTDPSEYDGGELHMEELQKEFKLAKNQAIIFDSNLMHGVRPVTRGKRQVLISFLFNKRDGVPLEHFRFHRPEGDLDYRDSWSDESTVLFQDNGARDLIITLSGMGAKGSKPAFIFQNFLKGTNDINKLFIRDLTRRYFTSFDWGPVWSHIRKHSGGNITLVGCSSGAWAAMWLGGEMSRRGLSPRVIAMAPQTTLDTPEMQVCPATAERIASTRETDLRILGVARDTTIHYGKHNSVDRWHAERMLPDVTVVAHNTANHMIALWLRDKGCLHDNIWKKGTSHGTGG